MCRSQCTRCGKGNCACNRHTQQLPLRGYDTRVQQKKKKSLTLQCGFNGGVPHLDRAPHVPQGRGGVVRATGGGAVFPLKIAPRIRTCSPCETKKTSLYTSFVLQISFPTLETAFEHSPGCTRTCPHLRLSLRTFSGLYLYLYFRIFGCPSMEQSEPSYRDVHLLGVHRYF